MVQNLQNGTPYAFKVRTANAVCVSELPSAFSEPIAPATKPGPPIIRSAVGGNREVTLFADPPHDNGGAPVVRFRFAVTRVEDQKIVAEIVCPVTDLTGNGSIRCTGLDEDTRYSVTGYVVQTAVLQSVNLAFMRCVVRVRTYMHLSDAVVCTRAVQMRYFKCRGKCGVTNESGSSDVGTACACSRA